MDSIHVKIPPETKKELEALAKSKGLNTSALIRLLISEALNK